jgi:excisionase family DNA binding protein
MSEVTKQAVKRAVEKRVTTPPFDPTRWFTIEEAAEAVRVSPRCMKRWAYNGAVKSVVLPSGRGRRISGAALNEAMSTEAAPVSYVH